MQALKVQVFFGRGGK